MKRLESYEANRVSYRPITVLLPLNHYCLSIPRWPENHRCILWRDSIPNYQKHKNWSRTKETMVKKNEFKYRSDFTCLTIVTAVLPLQKQSKFGCNLSSLSMALYDFRKASLHKEFSFSCGVTPGSVCLEAHELRAECSLMGKASLTFRATRWPYGPWPSKMPQKIVSSDIKSYTDSNTRLCLQISDTTPLSESR